MGGFAGDVAPAGREVIARIVQRWRDRRDSYRPAGEPIETSKYSVEEIREDQVAKAFVLEHHYSGCYPAARFRFGLYRDHALAGVAVFSHPCSDRVLTNVFPVPAINAVELGRFVLLDDVPANGETWFLARAFEILRGRGIAGVVSFSDPLPRCLEDGTTIFGGHVGTIYQASNGTYLGRSGAQTLRLLPDGTVFPARAISKIRSGERGWSYAAARLERFGASPAAAAGDLSGWLQAWLPRVTRPVRHRGNHRYAWALDRSLRRHLAALGPYPKAIDALPVEA
jgi:hypothetical protein